MTEYQQAMWMREAMETAYEMAFGRNPLTGIRWNASDEMAFVYQHLNYAVKKLIQQRCTDESGIVVHDCLGSICQRCGEDRSKA